MSAERIGAPVLDVLERLGRMGVFLGLAIGHAFQPPWQLGSTVRQLHFVGARSTLVIAVAGAFVGMVVGLQFYDTLVRFGSVSLLGSAVGLSLVRELSPVLTALIVIGRAGSAMCAEMGIMRSDNQIDSLECMAIDPYKYLIAPRFVAVLLAVPLLTARRPNGNRQIDRLRRRHRMDLSGKRLSAAPRARCGVRRRRREPGYDGRGRAVVDFDSVCRLYNQCNHAIKSYRGRWNETH
jgi:hypothetical protein